jgi:hypothetical protein
MYRLYKATAAAAGTFTTKRRLSNEQSFTQTAEVYYNTRSTQCNRMLK